MNLEELVKIIKETPSSLFYGTGVTKDCGGPSWAELLNDLKRRFPVGSESDPFKFMDEIIVFDNSNRKEVEDFIRTRLATISPKDGQKYLFSIPWRAVLTTNYDHLPNTINVTLDGNRQIISICSPDEPIDHTRVDRLYCFKLLGCVDQSYPQGGWMVLSDSDLFSESERRKTFFNQFRNLATSGHIIYLGYSFKDDLIFRLLNQMKTVTGKFPWKGFAITPSEPDPKTKKKLDSIGITWIKGDLKEFIDASKKVLGDIPTSSPLHPGCLTIHQRTIDIESSILSNIHNKFSILHNELLESDTSKPVDFLRGTDESYYPFVSNWDFPRKTKLEWLNPENKTSIPQNLMDVKTRIDEKEVSRNAFVALVGGAGSGKTVVARRLAFDWYQTGNPVIFINPDNLNIDSNALDGLMNDLREKYLAKVEGKKEDSHPIRWLIIADDCGGMLAELRLLKNHLISSGKPADIVLVSRETEAPIERLKSFDVDIIYRIDDTVMLQERDLFLSHFKRFGIDEELAKRNLADSEINSSFFALIYSCVRHSSENIRSLLLDEYNGLELESKKVYGFVSLIQAYRLQPLVSLLVKGGSIDYDWLENQANRGSLGGVVRFVDFGSVLTTDNRLIAETICDIAFSDSSKRKLALSKLISVITNGDYAEMKFLDTLLNSRIEQNMGPRITTDDKISLFQEGIKKVKSRPLLIHLGRVQTNAGKFLDAKKTLLEAHDANIPNFDEMPQHVLDAEGRLQSAQAEDALNKKENAKAWDFLDEAEDSFRQAKINPRMTPHPYEGLATVYLMKSKNILEPERKWTYILDAMMECNYVESYLGEKSEISLTKLEVEEALKRIGFNEDHINRIKDPGGKACGYAYLAEHAISANRPTTAFALVEKGLRLNEKNIWLLRLRVKLMRQLRPADHEAIMRTLNVYASMSDKIYDIELSFELAKEMYMSGNIIDAKRLFRELGPKSSHHPRRMKFLEQDRWMEEEKPKRLTGVIIKVPTIDRHGQVHTTYPSNLEDDLILRASEVEYKNPDKGQRVNYEVMFNMIGPQASKVRS